MLTTLLKREVKPAMRPFLVPIILLTREISNAGQPGVPTNTIDLNLAYEYESREGITVLAMDPLNDVIITESGVRFARDLLIPLRDGRQPDETPNPWPTKPQVKLAIEAALQQAREEFLAHPVLVGREGKDSAMDRFMHVMHGMPKELWIEITANKRNRLAKKIKEEKLSEYWGRTLYSVLEDIRGTDISADEAQFNAFLQGTAIYAEEPQVLLPDEWYILGEAARQAWNENPDGIPKKKDKERDWSRMPYKMFARQAIEVMILLDAATGGAQ